MAGIRNVVVGISGGVDSAVAALLLKKKGFNVTGVFMRNWDLFDENAACTVPEDYEDAKHTCKTLKIPFEEVNFIKEYWNEVFMTFTQEYQQGLTPNPDILCNKYIKFKAFFDHAIKNLNADALATGHYARTTFGLYLDKSEAGKQVKLLRSRDRDKDQTFFLSQVPQNALQKTMFPLGDLTKSEVKQIARENGLGKIAKKPESMGICFVGSRNFQNFISQYVTPQPGKFIDVETGVAQGAHEGIHMYTIGQRCKIGGLKQAAYIARKNVRNSDIFVAQGLHHPILYSSMFITEKPHWISEVPYLEYPGQLEFKFQHVKSLRKCSLISLKNDSLVVVLDKPLRALTPGQYSVFYKGDECLGSARIIDVGPSEYSLGNIIPADFKEYEDKETENAALKC